KDEANGAPENVERAAEFAGDVILEVREVCGVFHEPIRIRMCSAELRGENVGFCLCLSESDAGFETRKDGDGVAPVTDFVHVGRYEEIGMEARRKDGRKVEGSGEHADNGDGAIVEINGVADDGGIAAE